MSRGFTLIETIIALAVFGALLALSMPFLISFHTTSLFTDAVEQMMQDVRRSQSLAIGGVNDSAQGVSFDPAAEQWALFIGSTYVSGSPTNEVHTLASVVDLVSVSLSGGGSSIVFAERTGRTANTGTIVIRAGSRQATIVVNAAGVVSRQ